MTRVNLTASATFTFRFGFFLHSNPRPADAGRGRRRRTCRYRSLGGKQMAIRVFMIDDHALVRAGMRMILSAETDIDVVGEAENGENGLQQVR